MALNMSLRDKNAELLELFLKHGGDPNVKGERFAHSMRYDGKEEWYPIHTAARYALPFASITTQFIIL
jgi:hypothetical protein